MPAAPIADDPQALTLRAYTALAHLRPIGSAHTWPGSLILNIHLDPTGAAVSLAANIAGAACLTLAPDAARARTALRAGACDFVVNTLDEALRALKNEIRQRRPLSVALTGSPATLLDECLERGLAPQLFTAAAAHPEAAAHFHSLGAQRIRFHEPTLTQTLAPLLTQQGWTLHTLPFATLAELRAFDTLALALLPEDTSPETHLRRTWLTASPRLFPRDRHRALWLTPAEHQALTEL